MDLEHLNKHQVILLALFVSFVTSIATGIVTVSLMEQAPTQVQATVNHIVERTVQQVVPAANPASPATITTVKTVVVKDDDLAAQSIAAARQSIIRIVATSSPDQLVARGVIIDAKGVAITDRDSLDPDAGYQAILFDGSRVSVTVRPASTSTPIAILDLTLSSTTPSLTPATFADPSKLQLGQTVIRIGGVGQDNVAEGVISSLPVDASKSQLLDASVTSGTPGAILTDLYGAIIGITTAESLKNSESSYSMPSIFKAAAASDSAANAASAAASSAAGKK